MFFDASTRDHGLPHDPFKAIVSPRPIGWIGTRGRDDSRNLSPYSFFNAVSDKPKIVMFSAARGNDSPRNAEETGVFTSSFVSHSLLKQMNTSSTSVPYGVDEFALAGLKHEQGRMVDAPYVAGAFAVLECRTIKVVRPVGLDGQDADAIVVFGQVVGIHIDESVIRDGRFDPAIARPIGRMGYMDYTEASEVFEMMRPPRP
ncbi:flavin reductase family protein [Rhizobium sp. KVB221]|uniref:Flavin reductase family protein n=1 Tax=Rhizobium setariae TaxID=2801340 RepID=A0A937CPV2_9HYPH|nr:flavin reductase family protein [Rhizobium setariae]MBL0373013.1 flavin reductase family protein [Rhizobium setariae]